MRRGGGKGDAKGWHGGKPVGKGAGDGRPSAGTAQAAQGGGMLPRDLEPISREMGQLLRHRGLDGMRYDGYAPMAAVASSLKCRASTDQVEAVVLLSKRDTGVARFECWKDEKGVKWIRATDKRSLQSGAQGSAKGGGTGSGFGGGGGGQRAAPQQQAPWGAQGAQAQRPQADAANQAVRGDCGWGSAASVHMPDADIEGEYDADWGAPQAGCSREPQSEEPGTALADFNGPNDFGDEYIVLRIGAPLVKFRDPAEDHGWAFGRSEGSTGWFPARFWAPIGQEEARAPQAHRAGGATECEIHLTRELTTSRAENKQLTSENATLKGELELQRGHIAKLEADLAEMRRELDALNGRAASAAGADRQAF